MPFCLAQKLKPVAEPIASPPKAMGICMSTVEYPALPRDTTIYAQIGIDRYELKMTDKGLQTLHSNDHTLNSVSKLNWWPTANEFIVSLPRGTEVTFTFELLRGKMTYAEWEASLDTFLEARKKVIDHYGLTVKHEYLLSTSAGGRYVGISPLT